MTLVRVVMMIASWLLIASSVLFSFAAQSAGLSTAVDRRMESVLESLLCHQTESFLMALRKNNLHIPNGLSFESSLPSGGSNLIQPRMIQFALNLWRTQKYFDGNTSPSCREALVSVSNLAQESYIRTSDFFTNPTPWKRDFKHKVNYEHHLDIYDVADWLSISTSYHEVFIRGHAGDEDYHYAYMKSIEKILIAMISDSTGRLKLDRRGDRFPVKMKLPVGHLTLSLDALMMTDLATQRRTNLLFVRDILEDMIEAASTHQLVEDDRGLASTTLMTYGELFESINLYRKVYESSEFYYNAMDRLVNRALEDFMVDGKLHYYHKENIEKLGCDHVMSLEGFYTNILRFAIYTENPKLTKFVLENIYRTINVLGTPPMIETCSSQRKTHIAGYYAALKLLSFMAEEGILKQLEVFKNTEQTILNYIKEKLKSEIFIKSETADLYIEDISSNVWLYNEYIIPRYISISNHDVRIDDFYGCNFLYIDVGNLPLH